jgi:hypothetical protein
MTFRHTVGASLLILGGLLLISGIANPPHATTVSCTQTGTASQGAAGQATTSPHCTSESQPAGGPTGYLVGLGLVGIILGVGLGLGDVVLGLKDESTKTASLVGVAVGLGVLALYVAGGLIVAGWDLQEFFAHLSIDIVAFLVLAAAVAVAVVAVPVGALLRFRLVSPLVVLGLVVIGWLGIGFVNGTLSAQTVFGLAAYAFYLAPLYLVLYLVVGWIEFAIQR